MAETSIEWTGGPRDEIGYSFNGWIGCTPVSTERTGGGGCDNCYAETQDQFHGWTPEGWGAGKPRYRTGPSNWAQPARWNRQAAAAGERRKMFCFSLADWLDNEVSIDWLVDFLEICRTTPHLDKLLLTKRIGNWGTRLQEARECAAARGTDAMRMLVAWIDSWLGGHPPPDVWLGISAVTQKEADRDILKLLRTPARVRFLSLEPLLASINLNGVHDSGSAVHFSALERGVVVPEQVDWVIVGLESGTRARATDVGIVQSIVTQCVEAGTPVFTKQLGSKPFVSGVSVPTDHWPGGTRFEDAGQGKFRVMLRDKNGRNPAEWPETLQVRQWPALEEDMAAA